MKHLRFLAGSSPAPFTKEQFVSAKAGLNRMLFRFVGSTPTLFTNPHYYGTRSDKNIVM